MQIPENKLPFYDFFDILRKSGDFSLGIEEYYALIEALQGGFGLNKQQGTIDKDKLLEVCKLLWLKPNHSPYEFETLFNEFIAKIGRKQQTQPKNNDNPTPNEDSNKNPSGNKNPDVDNSQGDKNAQSIDNQKNKTEPDNKTSQQTPQPKNEKTDSEPQAVKISSENASGENASTAGTEKDKNRRFVFTENYFPISKRYISNLWDFLPSASIQSGYNKIDIQQTIQQYAQQGYLTELCFEKQKQIAEGILLLSDHQGSMIAFEQLSDLIDDTLNETFGDNKNADFLFSRYYFYNLLQDYIYTNQAHTKYISTENFIKKHQQQRTAIIIVSDAGAARGSNSGGRVRATIKFLFKLNKISNKIVWLNPMPEDRWTDTSAERIARFVPMISVEQYKLHKVIDLFKGKNTR